MPTQDVDHLITDARLLLPLIITNALHVLAAIAIMVIGFLAAGRIQVWVVRSLGRVHQLDAMLKSFFGNIIRYFVLTIAFLAVLSQFGIQTTSLVAVLGAAGLAIGLALQGTLSQLAAGVMLLIFRPFHIGQHVQIGGVDGIVRELSLFWTEVVTPDNVQVIIPNASVWGQPLKNLSVYPQAVGMNEVRFRPVGMAPAEAQTRVEAVLREISGVLKDPAPTVLLDRNATDNALEVVVSFAPAGGTAPPVKSEIVKAVYDSFAAAGAAVAETR